MFRHDGDVVNFLMVDRLRLELVVFLEEKYLFVRIGHPPVQQSSFSS